MMRKTLPQHAVTTIYDHVLMNFNVTHGSVLIPQAALEVPFMMPEERHLPEAISSKAKFSPKKIDPKKYPVAYAVGVTNRLFNFMGQARGHNLIRIQQQNPFILEWKRIKRPLPLFRPTAMVMKLHHLRTKGPSYFDGRIGALRVHHINFGK